MIPEQRCDRTDAPAAVLGMRRAQGRFRARPLPRTFAGLRGLSILELFPLEGRDNGNLLIVRKAFP
jgi:hypothetical protein